MRRWGWRFGAWGAVVLLAGMLAGCGAARPAIPPTATFAGAFPPPIVAAIPTAPATAEATGATSTPPTTRATPAATRAAPTATAAMGARANVPQKAIETLRYIQAHNGDPPPGYVGGATFQNRERRLPPGRYREYDVDPRMAGGRNAERLVIERDTGQAYYTPDHYFSFIPITAGR